MEEEKEEEGAAGDQLREKEEEDEEANAIDYRLHKERTKATIDDNLQGRSSRWR